MLSSVLLSAVVFVAVFGCGGSDAFHAGGPSKKGQPSAPHIKHIVVLMLENRPFDHMCGWLKRDWDIPVDGLTGKEFNVVDNVKYYVNDTCPYINPFDPYHDVRDTTLEVMGGPEWISPAPMDGFAKVHAPGHPTDFPTVMHGFPPARVPAISTLAKEFAVFDNYFASLPGPTFPNRLFFGSGTSHGFIDDSNASMLVWGAPQRTLYDSLEDNNKTWRQYFADLPDLLLFKNIRQFKNIPNFKFYNDFLGDVKSGDLPYFSWIAPQFFPNPWDGAAKDQHPDHDVAEGDRLIAEIYGTLRNSTLWEDTMFIVTYDEHGGFYDHVPPPPGPNPDGIIADDGFNFTRLGVRVCTVVASPWIKKGTVVSQPADPSKQYEHSSMFATLRDMVGIDEQLNKRTEFAASFAFLLNSTGGAPRTDCPESLPIPPTQADPIALQKELDREPNHLQQNLFGLLEATLLAKRQEEKNLEGGATTTLESVTKDMTYGSQFKSQGAMSAEVKRLVNELFLH